MNMVCHISIPKGSLAWKGLFILSWAMAAFPAQAQVLIGPDDVPPHPSALLHLDAGPFGTDVKKGVLPPNVALTRTHLPGPLGPLPLPASLLVYNTATTTLTGDSAQYNVYPGFYSWDGSRWLRFEAGVGRHVYVNNTTATFSVPYAASFTAVPATYIPGLWTNSTILYLRQGDRVFLEAHGAFELATGNTGSPANDEIRYTDVEVQLMVSTNTMAPWGGTVLATATVSLDTRLQLAAANSFFFGLFSSSQSGFAQRVAFQNWSLAAYYDVPANSPDFPTSMGNLYKFWVRARMTRNQTGTTVTTGTPGTGLEGCLRTEIFHH